MPATGRRDIPTKVCICQQRVLTAVWVAVDWARSSGGRVTQPPSHPPEEAPPIDEGSPTGVQKVSKNKN
jgi:hypothetical protein